MDDHEAMLAIQELLDGVEWNSDTLGQIAPEGFGILEDEPHEIPKVPKSAAPGRRAGRLRLERKKGATT